MDDDDEDLVHRARAGDGAALGRLFDRFWTPVLRYLAAQLGSVQVAEDMAAEVFVEVAERIHRFSGDETTFGAWVFTIARHDLYDLRRSQARRTVVPVADVPEGASDDPDVVDEVSLRLDAVHLAAAMRLLTPDQREVLLLKYAGGLGNPEVSQLIGKPVTAVKSLQHRALAALRRALEAEGVESP